MAAYIYANELSVSFPGNAVHKTDLRSQTLLYQTLYANEIDIQHFLKTVGFHQKYSDIKTPALGFDSETCSNQPSILLTTPPTIRISEGGIYFCDVTNTRKQFCSPNEPFCCCSWKGIAPKIYIFRVDFEICNFVDCFIPKNAHWLKFKKWKHIIRPL